MNVSRSHRREPSEEAYANNFHEIPAGAGIALTMLLPFNDTAKVIGSHSKSVLSPRHCTRYTSSYSRDRFTSAARNFAKGLHLAPGLTGAHSKSKCDDGRSFIDFVLSISEIPWIFPARFTNRLVRNNVATMVVLRNKVE